MIRIQKGPAPPILATAGVAAAARLCDAYDQEPDQYDGNTKTFTIDRNIYAHPEVFGELVRTHHGKCAYCEVKIPAPYADRDVEHWRPKKAVKLSQQTPRTYPGYYWLAYDWDNLLLSCAFCNRHNKGNRFYLKDPQARARNHHHDYKLEVTATVKPDGPGDPRDHIFFEDEFAKDRTPEGRATIDMLGLDRVEHAARDSLLTDLKYSVDFIINWGGDAHPGMQASVARERAFLAAAVEPTAPFSAMAMDYLKTVKLPDPTP